MGNNEEKPKDPTVKKRVGKFRDKLKAQGFVRREVWIDPNDPEDLKKLADLDRSKRTPKT